MTNTLPIYPGEVYHYADPSPLMTSEPCVVLMPITAGTAIVFAAHGAANLNPRPVAMRVDLAGEWFHRPDDCARPPLATVTQR